MKIDGSTTKEQYKYVLEYDLINSLNSYGRDLKQDNDPKHTAILVRKWLSEQEFEVMNRPAQSSDYNPIENIWDLLKKRLFRDYECPPSGKIEHWERIH